MATVKTVRLKDFSKELKRDTEVRLEDYKKAVVNGIAKSIPALVAASPVDTGQYANSWDMSADDVSAILGNFAPHAPIIEAGARPFTPPIGPLLAWAKRVLKSSSQPPDYDSEVWGLAKGTQNKIAAEGMQPRHILENMIPVIIENIKAELKRGR